MKTIIMTENGEMLAFGENHSIVGMMRYIKDNDVEVIVIGEVDGAGNIVWEKQFKPVTVMPASFGQRGS